MQRVCPHAVQLDSNGWLSVSYAELVPVLISAFNQRSQEGEVFQSHMNADLADIKQTLQVRFFCSVVSCVFVFSLISFRS